jgi:hypothetical protein
MRAAAEQRDEGEHDDEGQVFRPRERGQAEQEPRQRPCEPMPAAVAGPEEAQDRAGQRQRGEGLAHQLAREEDRHRVDREQAGGDQAGERAAQPAAEQVHEHDRQRPEQRDRKPCRARMDAAGRVVDGGIEQRRARRPVVRAGGARQREALVLVELLGDRRVDRRIGAGPHVERLERRLDPQRQAEHDDRGEREKHEPAVAVGEAGGPGARRRGRDRRHGSSLGCRPLVCTAARTESTT